MPGIVGLVTKMRRNQAWPALLRMVEAIQHEDFYVSGTWGDESLGIYVGWVVPKNSFSDGMPLRNDRGDVVLIFSGEEFPEPGTERRLKERGHRLNPGAPSYLIHLSESDPNFPAGLNGRFQGLLIDRTGGAATLFNDRYGMHRIYYHPSKEAFSFAAEAKAILAVRPELRSVEPHALGELVACGCVLENRTLFEGVHVLPGAAKWVIRDGSVEQKGTYFHPREWEEQEILEPEKYYQEIREVFTRNLPRYFQSQERIGMSLTGGLDTRMIMAWQKPLSGSLPCYTFSGTYRDCQDVIVAEKVARACGQAHEVIQVGEDFLSSFHRYAERTVYLTDGCADVRRASDLYLNERAREIAPIRMTGNYGSEVLRHVRAFKPTAPMPGLYQQDVLSFFHQADRTYSSLLKGHPLSFAVFKQAPWHHYGLLALEQTQVSLRSPFLDNDFVRTVFRAPESDVTTHDFCLRLIAEGSEVLREIPTDRGVGGAGLFGSASRNILEFLAKAEYAYDYGMPQRLAQIDHFLSPFHFERLFLGRHKFNHYRVWYRDALAEYIREMLLDSRTLSRPYVERKNLEAMVHGHLKGDRNYTSEIHNVLTLELLHRLFIDQK
ncbi:MAG: asparagine synthase-related protein [Nitrospirales bacterium]